MYEGQFILGKYYGAWFGARLSNAPKQVKKYLGFCLFSQAGVAIGLAISAQIELSEFGSSGKEIGFILINVITASTFFFQIIGPIATKYALHKANEIRPL